MKRGVIYTVAGLVALLLITNRKKIMTWYDLVSEYFTKFEGFSPVPYWDVKRWSWGYGTRVPGSVDDPSIRPGGTISRLQAFTDAYDHVDNDYNYLQRLIKIPLTPGQWAAYLSFSYNLGSGNADNLVANINARNWQALKNQWLQYNKAGGVYNQHLADRRKYEVNEFLKDT